MIRLLRVLIVIVLCASFMCAYTQKRKSRIKKSNHRKEAIHKKADVKYGIASFYADKFKGRLTAGGEIYLPEKYTAACNQFPLFKWIKVTNLKNQKSVIVKINDRLHSKNKRLVDLSKIAAKKLGFVSSGLTKVKVEKLDRNPDMVNK